MRKQTASYYDIHNKRYRIGFTIVEVVIASTILSFIFIYVLLFLSYQRLQSRKAMEEAIMLDFMQHYMEIARNQSFFKIIPGQPINFLYDGAHGAPNIRFPADTNWYSLYTTNFRNFHPDLEWLKAENPEYSCAITNQVIAGGITRSKRITLQVRWRPPLMKTVGRITLKMDTVVYQGFN